MQIHYAIHVTIDTSNILIMYCEVHVVTQTLELLFTN